MVTSRINVLIFSLFLVGHCSDSFAAAAQPDMGVGMVTGFAAAGLMNNNGTLRDTVIKAVVTGLALSLPNSVGQVLSSTLSRIIAIMSQTVSFVSRISGKGYNSLCKRPDPVLPEELIIWDNTFEGVINSLCEQTTSGNLMLKNIRVSDSDDEQQDCADDNWIFFVGMVQEVCGHIKLYLNERLPYYAGGHDQRKMLVTIANGVSVENRESIAFMIRTITGNLDHLVRVCQNVKTAEDLDVVHIKKLGRITSLLFRKLHTMIAAGQSGTTAPSGSGYQMGGSITER